MVLLCPPQKWGTTEVSQVLLFLKFNSGFPIAQKDTTLCFTCGSNQFPFTIWNSSLWKNLPPAVSCHLSPMARTGQEGAGSAGCPLSQTREKQHMSDKIRSQKPLFLRNELKNPKKLYSFLSLKNFLKVNSQWSSWKWILHCISVSKVRHRQAPHCFSSVKAIS